MNNISFTPFPELATERLVLRRMVAEDIKEFHILKSDARILEFLYYKPKTMDEARIFLQKLNDDITKNECIIWGIAQKGENKLIGSICFWNIVKERSKAEIGYELMPEYFVKGIMTEAMKAVMKYGFDKMRLELIEAVPYVNNIKSIKLLERNNFVRGECFKEDDSSLEQVIYKYCI
jgi:ribosomal-protein-alanine N-acetyltransferase